MTRGLLVVAVAALAAAGCGGSRDWEQEVILQLFRPARSDLGAVTVRVAEGGKTVEKPVTVGAGPGAISFDDCDKNRVRIIPRQGGATTYAPLDITVLFGVGARREARVSTPVPAPAVVKLVLDTGVIAPNLEPQACAPSSVPPVRRPLGAACDLDPDCEGGICLKEVPVSSSKQLFPKGYCTFRCDSSGASCDSGRGVCKLYTDAASPTPHEYGPYCLRRCKDCAPSVCLPCADRLADGYVCSPLDLCYPSS